MVLTELAAIGDFANVANTSHKIAEHSPFGLLSKTALVSKTTRPAGSRGESFKPLIPRNLDPGK
jgi:hypothetical protein